MRNGRRVAVTGLGVVTPIGTGVESFWEGLRARKSAVRTVTRFDPEPFRTHMAGEVPDFVAGDWVDGKRAKRLDRCSLFTIAAARLALTDANLDLAREDHDRAGAMMGTALGGAPHAEADHERFVHGGIKAVDPGLALNVFAGASSTNLAIEFGITGPNVTNGMSCASGSIAIGEAYRAIRAGDADLMLAGGAEAPLAPLTFGAFSIIRAMSTRNEDPGAASRPFDRARDGFVMAEGASIMVLEEYGRAVARGAPIYFEIAGYGLTNDAYHMTAPRPDGSQAARAMQLALRDAHITPAEVQYVNAHGSSTPLNDPTETGAIRQVFGDHADTLAVSGTKGYYGHALGASGAIEAAICALASRHCWLPPTVNLAEADPACDLDYLAGNGRPADPEHLVSNSFGFGGINAVLVFRKT